MGISRYFRAGLIAVACTATITAVPAYHQAKAAGAPILAGTLDLTNAQSGQIFSVPVGERINVSLSPVSGFHWSTPRSANTAVVAPVPWLPGNQSSTVTSFNAVATGTAGIWATDTPNCYPRCLMLSGTFHVTIVVIGAL